MWYLEIIFIVFILILVNSSIYFIDVSSEEYQVDYEAIRLMATLKEIQERSRNYHYMDNNDFRPLCYIYEDKYIVQNFLGENSEIYYLKNNVKIDFYDTANFYTFRQQSLYNAVPNKTLKVFKNDKAKYIIINRVGRIRISKFYKEPS